MDQAAQLRNIIKGNAKPEHLSRVITVTSGKGGVGKSSFAVNLALHLQRMGKKVVVLDADFGLANIEIMLGTRPSANLADLMYGGKTLKDILTEGPEGVGFISAGSGIKELANLKREQIFYVLHSLVELDDLADVIIIDTGAGITDSVLDFVVFSQEVLLIVTPEPTSITDAYALLKTLHSRQEFETSQTRIKLVANRVKNEQEGKEIFDKVSIVAEKFLNVPLQYLGCIPEDKEVSKAIIKQVPLLQCNPSSVAALSMIRLANQLEDLPMNQVQEVKGIKKIFTNLLHAKLKK